jgi:hypothetical protein
MPSFQGKKKTRSLFYGKALSDACHHQGHALAWQRQQASCTGLLYSHIYIFTYSFIALVGYEACRFAYAFFEKSAHLENASIRSILFIMRQGFAEKNLWVLEMRFWCISDTTEKII